MGNRNPVVRCMVLAVLTLCVYLNFVAYSNAQSSQLVDNAGLAKNLIVKVRGENTSGTGIIFGRSGNILFVATANHVVRWGMKEAQDLRVEFSFWPEGIAAKLSGKFDSQLDLAMLLVDLNQSYIPDDLLNQSLPLDQGRYVREVKKGDNVYPIGHPPAQDWFVPIQPAVIYGVEGEKIRFHFQCDQGYSGGGLFDEQWNLVGMIRTFNPPLCEAISFERLRATLKKWRFVVSLKSAPMFETVAGQEKHDSVSGIDFVWVPKGCFQMGSPYNEQGRIIDEDPVHKVCIDGFWIGKYEVTQEQWQRMMGENPSYFHKDRVGQDTSNYPVESVSWNDVREFLQKLNQQVGKTMYRLPTEAEWEYAARAGTGTMFYFGNDIDRLGDYAWYGGNSNDETHLVGQRRPNDWGLYDMHGNVWEWCQDWYDENYYARSPSENPQGPFSGEIRVLRGGSWLYSSSYCRSAARSRLYPDNKSIANGFRVVVGSGAWTLQ